MAKDEITENEKIEVADDTFATFFESLGPNDIYKKIFLEVLFEEIYGHPCDLSDIFPKN
jgi:hypothetical protein